jgi:hypothetical protein
VLRTLPCTLITRFPQVLPPICGPIICGCWIPGVNLWIRNPRGVTLIFSGLGLFWVSNSRQVGHGFVMDSSQNWFGFLK